MPHPLAGRPARPSARRICATVVVATQAIALAGCEGSGYGPAEPPTPRNLVSATPSLAFSPAEITIAVGDSVTWAFGGIPHNVSFQTEGDSARWYGGRSSDRGAPAKVATLANGSATRVFGRAGSFSYRCTLHPGMTGEVRVR